MKFGKLLLLLAFVMATGQAYAQSLETISSQASQMSRSDFFQFLAQQTRLSESIRSRNQLILLNVFDDASDRDGEAPNYGPPAANQLISLLGALGDRYLDLLSDPGLITHARSFANFLKKCEQCGTLSPWKVRELFSAQLGSATVYRGVNLDEAGLEKVRKVGFLSGALRNQSDSKTLGRVFGSAFED